MNIGVQPSGRVRWQDLTPAAVYAAFSQSGRALIRCLRLAVADDDPATCAEVLANLQDWDGMLQSARRQDLLPHLFGVLRSNGLLELAPADARETLKRAFVASNALGVLAQRSVEEILSALDAQSCQVMLLKGLALGHDLYSDPALRPFCDLDLVIRDGDWEQFRAIMIALGYRPGPNDTPVLPRRLLPQVDIDHVYDFLGPQGLLVEVKFDLLELGLRMRDMEGVWQRARPLPFGTSSAGVRPAAEDELIMLCVHVNRHGFRRMRWLVDIGLFLRRYPDLDWRAVSERVRAEGVLPSVHYTLLLVDALFGPLVPAAAKRQTAPPWLASRVWKATWPCDDALFMRGKHEASLVFRKRLRCPWLPGNLLLTGRVAEKASYFVRRVVPPRDFLLEKYGLDPEESYGRALLARYASAFHRAQGGV